MLWTRVTAQSDEDFSKQLRRVDQIKLASFAEFAAELADLEKRSASFSLEQRSYFNYLKGWKSAYEGNYRSAIQALTPIVDAQDFPVLRLRAGATMANVLVLSAQYQEAFSQLNRFLAILPQVTDGPAREQALAVAALIYFTVGEYELTRRYAQVLTDENWDNRGSCTGGQLKLRAKFKSGQLSPKDPELASVMEACDRIGETIRASAVATYLAMQLMSDGQPKDAMQILLEHYDKTRRLGTPQILAEYDSLVAQVYMQLGDGATARQYALRALSDGVKNEFTEPLVKAYWILYQNARARGDSAAALSYHEKYTTADKGYLDDISARQIAYERVKHEVAESALQIEALNRQNEVLKLQRQLSDKVLENVRLYIILSTVVLGFIGFWAYRTKLSQLHFMKLSRLDGLTGVFNRPHFIEQSNRALQSAKKSGQAICVVICDLDHFKSINDNWGHAAGDSVLKRTVNRVSALLRDGDLFGRLGGEEFGILLVECDAATARHRCELLRAAVAEVSVSDERAEVKLSASFGIACSAASGHEFRQLLAHADAALYEAKRAGRDRVVVYDAEKFNETVADAAERLSA